MFMKLFSQNLEILASMLWRHHLKIGSKRLKFVYHIQLMIKIIKSGTIITLVEIFFSEGKFLNFETSILVLTSLFQNWNYQGRTYIWDAFSNFLKLQVFITDSASYLTEELLFNNTCFYRTPLSDSL